MHPDKQYYYDPDTCSFVEAEPDRKDQFRKAGYVAALVLVLAGLIAWAMDAQLIGTPEEQALKAENEALQEKLDEVGSKMGFLTDQIGKLSERDRELYRALLQVEPISEDVQQMGVGGNDPYSDYDRFEKGTSTLLKETAKTLDELERQVSLQSASYRELAAYAEQREDRLLQLPAIRPANGLIVSGYGMRMHPILKVRKMHAGIDVLLHVGTPVYATGDGVIRRAGYSPTYGKYVDINHTAAGYMTRYAHLSEIPDEIKRGVTVKRGQMIALSGNTGRSTGPHLHYEVRDSQGRTLNPFNFFVPDMKPSNYLQMLEEVKRFDQHPNFDQMMEGGDENEHALSDAAH